VQRLISVKYNISSHVFEVLRERIEGIIREYTLDDDTLRLKIGASADPSRLFITVRLLGQHENSIAAAKSKIEKLMLGTVIVAGNKPVWDQWFCTDNGSQFLSQLGSFNKVHISVQRRTAQLLLYGASKGKRLRIKKRLAQKLEQIHNSRHVIALAPDLPLHGTR